MPNYGPQLPPGFIRTQSTEADEIKSTVCFPESVASNIAAGADASEQAEAETYRNEISKVDEDRKIYGPVLPDTSVDTRVDLSSTKRTIGPVIPVELLIPPKDNSARSKSMFRAKVIGPSLPPHLSAQKDSAIEEVTPEAEDDDLVGPSLSLMASEGEYSAAQELSRRFQRQQEKLLKANEPEVAQREEWMTDLPESLLGRNALPALPTGPRTFKRRADEYEADFSGWTSGPGGKQKKQDKDDSVKELQYHQSMQRDRQLEQQISKHNEEKRGESLVIMAQKDKKPSESTGRSEFDRERDLGIRKVTKLDQDEVARRASALKDRFSSSGTSGQKYL